MNIKNRYIQAVKFLYSFFTKPVSLDILTFAKVTQKNDTITYEVTDLDNFLKITLPFWTKVTGEFLIDVKTFMKTDLKYATKINKEVVHIDKLRIPRNDTSNFPSLQTEFFSHPVWEANAVNLKELTGAGKRLQKYTANSGDTRSVLQNICLRPDYYYATDGHIALKEKHNLYVPKDTSFVIPACFFQHLSHEFVLCDSVDIGVYSAGKEDVNYIVAKGMSFELVSKMPDDQYPVVDNLIPKKYVFRYTINKNELLEIVKKAINFATGKNFMMDIIPDKKDNETLHISVIDREKGTEFTDSVHAKSNVKKGWNGVSVNARNLSAILSDCKGNTIELKANESAISAVIIEPVKKNQLFIIMPLRKVDVDEVKEDKVAQDEKKPDQNNESKKK